jgi:hypothetical protein
MRLKLIACEIVYREICAAVAGSPNRVDVEFLPKGLHDIGARAMHRRLKEVLDGVDEGEYEAVLFGYALCGNGLVGLAARSVPLVLPRAHDCITLFLGSKERYLEVFHANPGVYFKTTGWIERGEELHQLDRDGQLQPRGVSFDYAMLVEKYGEDNARYLQEQLGDYTKNYKKLAYIRMGVGPDEHYRERTREEARRRNMEYEDFEGDLSLLQRLVDGDWSPEDFLIVRPGERVVARYGTEIVDVEPARE